VPIVWRALASAVLAGQVERRGVDVQIPTHPFRFRIPGEKQTGALVEAKSREKDEQPGTRHLCSLAKESSITSTVMERSVSGTEKRSVIWLFGTPRRCSHRAAA
jgi:hypothetical protein